MIDRYAREAMKAIWQDQFKFETWLEVELAVCKAWAEHGEIPTEDIPLLERATFDMAHWEQAFATTRHDVTAFLSSVSRDLGPESRHIHKGLTSNDVWDTATALQLRAAGKILLEGIDKLEEAIARRAVEHKDTLMMGRTHGVHAEPTTFGLKLALWVEETRRMRTRLEQATRGISVGKFSGAVGTHATLPPEVEETACQFLGLKVEKISSQIVPRDRHAEFVSVLALCAASLEKFATEIRGLQRTEVREVEEPFHAGQTGSSAMPHKRNPELSERICGLARLIRGHSVTALENVALWHERDISHSSAERIILPDATMALDYILDLATYVIGGMVVYPETMLANVEKTKGLVFSQRVMLALLDKGLSREEAYKITQTASMESWEKGQDFRELLRQNADIAKHLPSDELESIFDYGYYTRFVDESFGRIGLISRPGCLCGCGEIPIGKDSIWVPGHDGRARGLIEHEMLLKDVPADFRSQMAAVARSINGQRLAEWAIQQEEIIRAEYEGKLRKVTG